MDATDPLCAISSTARLLPRTLGPAPAIGPSPSKARDALLEAIALARSLKGSEELVKQATMVPKEHGDIQALYHDDGVKGRPPANGSKEQQGRRPALDRKRARSRGWHRISELEKHLFPGGAANAKCTDDESKGSPDIVMGEPSLVHYSSDVLMTDENFTASDVDRETPNLGARAADPVLDPEPNLPDHAYERQPGGSSLGLYRDTEVGVAKENETCSKSIIFVEEDDVPIDYITIGRSTDETEVSSSHPLEGSSTEELVTKPVRHAAPDGICRTSHAAEDSIQHLVLASWHMKRSKRVVSYKHVFVEVCSIYFFSTDKSSQLLEMPQEDINPLNQAQMHGGSTKKSAPDLSPTKQKKQQAVQERKRKQQSKRGKKWLADTCMGVLEMFGGESLKIPQTNFESENQPHNDDVNIEKQTITSSTPSPNGAKEQKRAQRRNQPKKRNQRKILGDADLACQPGVRKSSRTRSRPLEYWLGERLLYGPIHDNLHGAIGIKAYSPGQDGKRSLKVKSFVPEQYSDLVAKSARY
ncbi:centromere protein C [Zea mays]|uniref:Centromere protein C n=1 Tax=Zea mays TaxID=4577 RepID=A0A1D6JN55_MAIZE|nr:centromere protein C [Zea mays]